MRGILKRVWARRKLRWAVILALPAMMALSVVGVELSSTSTFCNSCHIMNSFHDSWKVSSHKDVECIQCHIPPGLTNLVSAKLNGLGQAIDDILERTGTQPSANVSDASCTREGCHDVAAVRAIPKREKPFFFAHDKHLDLEYQGIQIHCNTCHSHIKGDKHFEVNTGVCVTCHLLKTTPGAAPTQLAAGAAAAPPVRTVDLKTAAPALAGAAAPPAAPGTKTAGAASRTPATLCRDCHQPPAQPIQYRGLKVVHAEYLTYGAACESCHRGVTAAPEPITDDRCLGCHDFGRERMTSVGRLHEEHSVGKHKVECFGCHGLIRHGPSVQTMRLDQIDCRACHQGQHQIQQQTYKFAGAEAHQPSDSQAVTPMFMAHVDCTGCHTQVRAVSDKRAADATVASATANACDSCHKPGLGEQMIPLWQKNTRALYENVQRMMPDAARPPPSPRAEQLINEARQLLTLVRLDGSWGVHNPPYTQKLIEQARDKIMEAAGPAAVSSTAPAGAPTSAPVR